MKLRSSLKSGAGVALLAFVAATPLLAAPKNASIEDLRADVSRLRGVVAACAATKTCEAAAVGDDLKVGDPQHGGYEVHWDWLRDALEKSKTTDARRAGLMADSTAALERIRAELDAGASGSRSGEFGRARSEAAAVLAQPEFQRHEEITWWDRLKTRLFGWLFRLVDGLSNAGARAPWIGPVVEWIFFAGAAVGLLIFLLRTLSRQRLRVAMEGAPIQSTAWDREATDWAQQAEQYASSGEWREAVHCLYWAAIVSMESRRAWRHNPTRTPREYLRLLKPGSAQQRGLRGLTRIFERVWYGLRDARPEEYNEARGLYEALASGAVVADGGVEFGAVGEGGRA
jgi:hypothetical protein